MRKRICGAAVSMLDGKMVHHDRGLYPTWCKLEPGHAGNHSNGENWWGPEPAADPDEQQMVERLQAGAL